MHDVVRLLTGSAADWLDDYFEHEAVKGYHASSSDHRLQGRPDVAGLRAGAAVPQDGRARRPPRLVGVPQGRQRRVHPGARPRGAGVRRGDPARRRRSTRCSPTDGRAVGVALEDGTEFRAPVVVSALDPRRTFLELVDPRELPRDLVDNVRADEVPRRLGEGQLRPRRAAASSRRCPGPSDHYGGFLNIGPTIEYVERAFDAAKYGWYSERPFIDAAIQSVVDPDMAPPGKHVHVVLRAVRAVRAAGERLGDRAGQLRRHRPGGPRVALPGLRRPGAAPRGRHAGRHRARHRADGGQHLRRRVPRPADVLLPAGARLEPVRHPDRRLLPVRLRAPTPAAASSAPPAGSPASGSCGTWPTDVADWHRLS